MPNPPGAKQLELIARSKNPLWVIDPNHRLVLLADALDWVELEAKAQDIRRRKLKSRAGRPPNLRVLLGAVIFMSVRRVPYRDAEDLLRHYTPARYLCGLTESTWTPDFTTIHDFTKLMGAKGLCELNEMAVKMAVEQGFGDPGLLIADTTAQEAQMSYPTEVGLLDSFFRSLQRVSKHSGVMTQQALGMIRTKVRQGMKHLRTYRFFAKSKDERLSLTGKAVKIVKQLGRKLRRNKPKTKKQLRGNAKAAKQRLGNLLDVMDKLIPQIEYWLKTGYVAKNKIVNLMMPLVRSIPRGKVGKDVEFGIKWGVSRIGGGFILGWVDSELGNFNDQRHVRASIDEHMALFGSAPNAFAYDRGGWSPANNDYLAEAGVLHNGIAPQGRAAWKVKGQQKKELVKQRARIEGDIGSIKSQRYGFNRPAARSEEMMITCGHRAMLGYNLNKLIRMHALRAGLAVTG